MTGTGLVMPSAWAVNSLGLVQPCPSSVETMAAGRPIPRVQALLNWLGASA